VAYSAEQVLLNKPQIYGGPAKLHCYRKTAQQQQTVCYIRVFTGFFVNLQQLQSPLT